MLRTLSSTAKTEKKCENLRKCVFFAMEPLKKTSRKPRENLAKTSRKAWTFAIFRKILLDGPTSEAHKMNVARSLSTTFSTCIALMFCTETPGPRCHLKRRHERFRSPLEKICRHLEMALWGMQYFYRIESGERCWWIEDKILCTLFGLPNRTYPGRARQGLSATCCSRWHRRFLHSLQQAFS